MLGWEFFIDKQLDGASKRGIPRRPLASWKTGLSGIDWLEELVNQGQAEFLGGDGYPLRYRAKASVLALKLLAGPPVHRGPLVIGDDYVMAPDYTGAFTIDRARFSECQLDEILEIEAWDLS